jgi:methionyl-tRNA formyltransferase
MIKIVFLGTPDFSAQVLDYLLAKEDIEVRAVISNPDRPKGRKQRLHPTPVKALLEEKSLNIPILQPLKPKGEEFYSVLRDFEADIFVVVAFGAILTSKLIAIPKIACINLHTSLLPKYRGAAPIQKAILEGETESGVSIMHVVKELDAGDIISQDVIPITVETNFTELERSMLELGKEKIYQAIKDLSLGKASKEEQNHTLMTYAHKIHSEDLKIDLNGEAEKIDCQIRAFSEKPGAFLDFLLKGKKKRVKILKAQLHSNNFNSEPGHILSSDKQSLIVQCKKGSLELLELQLEGKKVQKTSEFLLGYPKEAIDFISLLKIV